MSNGDLNVLAAPTFRRAGTAALFSRGAVVASGVATSILLPLSLDQNSVGKFFLAQLVIAGLATLGQLGLPSTIPATVNESTAENDFGRARQLIVRIVLICLLVSSSAAILAMLWLPNLLGAVDATNRDSWAAIVPILALTVPLSSLTTILVETLRSVHAIRAAANLAALGSLFTAGFLVLVFLRGGDTTLRAVLAAGLTGWTVGAMTGLALVGRAVWRWRVPARRTANIGSLVRHTLPNLFTTLTLFAVAHVDLFLLSALGTMSDVAQYGIALRFSALLVIPLAIANAAFAPLGVEARAKENTELLREMLRKLVLVSAGLAALLYAGFAIAGYGLISAWNDEYKNAYGLTLILGLGNVLHACGGSAGVLLMVWGDQRRAFTITLLTSIATVALCVVGLAYGGVFGLAAGAAVGNVLQVVAFVLRVRNRFHLDPSLVGVRRALSVRASAPD
ncbi:MAG: hypothetical protein GEV05_23190 [Betaproteobacteria bacterium]|nr:hypothetical protein [Betaproteobacteria bacterium]